ncbi:GH25 family lysozyme [Lactiplantibacillus plantarum]|uniref:GH25 family lysozyme n=1 Tax=Lactiplantibacillus plantarum TaxID=1590 RepID=UPI002165DA62|nr:GH25 family lysozyme [Lactiplantibacillus plantarum]UVW04638.1 LysM peptidoglycan-binding domain-containing protein [Lactiplantibacillus plantarum]UWF34810.1 LysM peptidoglycan-binding domain-containing protein [Lactiplantibacillus plantarum]
MKQPLKHKIILTGAAMMAALFLGLNVNAARMDMVDVSNNNGYMSTAEYVSMRNEFGVKALTVKISEGTTFKDGYASSNIKNGQAAGLYVNGYHFAHYTTKAQAIAEADYAGQTAKAVGLPVGAVLATDVEAEQANLPKGINDANNRAFMNKIAKFGYRTDIYTSGSWANHKMTIKGKTGWIAAYPYVPAGKQWYSNNNAWQWSGSTHFRISSGDFDVSQLNNNYYTAGQSSTVKANDPGAVEQQNHQANRATGTIPNQTYTQNGLFCPNTTLNVRTGAGTGYPKIATYYPEESVVYNQVIVKADYVWARYLRYNGQFGYIALGENGGQSYGKRLVNQHTYYTIKYGDSLWTIARRYGTTVSHLASLNGMWATSLILPGQRLVVS